MGLAEQLIEDHPGGEEVGGNLPNTFVVDIWGEVWGRRRHGLDARAGSGGNVEVEKFHSASPGEHDVLGLDVPVHESISGIGSSGFELGEGLGAWMDRG